MLYIILIFLRLFEADVDTLKDEKVCSQNNYNKKILKTLLAFKLLHIPLSTWCSLNQGTVDCQISKSPYGHTVH